MEDLLNKEHIASKFIHYFMKSCGYPPSTDQLLYRLLPKFLQENLDLPPFSKI